MYNDSLETLLLRHYGDSAPTPPALEKRLIVATRQVTAQKREQERVANQLREYRFSRRRAVKWVAIGSAGLGLLGAGLESLHMLETALTGQEQPRPAYS
jgi:hypothetical protein